MDHQTRILTIYSDIDRFFRDFEIITSESTTGDGDVTRFHAKSMILKILSPE